MTQKESISRLCKKNKDAVIIGSIGTISYDLQEIKHDNKILIKGAMGAVLGFALGYSLFTDKRVVAIIGDGSCLMKLGSVSTILKHNPKNLKVYIINNNSYQSCGGQSTNFKYIKKMFRNNKIFKVI